jgi:hypothetical protein
MRHATSIALLALVLSACGQEGGGNVPRVTSLTPQTHEPFFPIATGFHQGLECNACHGKFDTFRRFECIDCHKHERDATDAIHAGMADYGYDSAKCLNCHPRGAADGGAPADHDAHFPISTGAHAGVSCASCHLSVLDRTQISCSSGSCHPATEVTPQHALVSDFVASPACERCHGDGQVNRVAAHAPFALGAGAPHPSTDRTRGACLTCHPRMRADKSFAADFRQKSCTDASCHAQPKTTGDHAGVTGFVYATGSCLLCHPSGSRADAVDHMGFFPIGPGTQHDVACTGCHTDPADQTVVSCAGACHASADMTTAHTGKVGGFVYESATCLRCHADTPAFRVASHPAGGESAFNSRRHGSKCLACHQAPRTDRPYPAADFQKTDCRGSGCHSSKTGPN